MKKIIALLMTLFYSELSDQIYMVYRYGIVEAQDERRVYLLIRNAQITEIIQVMDELSQAIKSITTY